jgi:hypothetical protein
MKSATTLATSLCISLAAAMFASSVSAQNGTPNSAPSRPNKVVTVPPPPPGGPDKVATKTLPDTNGPARPSARPPKPFDEFAYAKPDPRAAMDRRCQNNSWCHSMYVQSCDDEGGGMRTNENGSEECVLPN